MPDSASGILYVVANGEIEADSMTDNTVVDADLDLPAGSLSLSLDGQYLYEAYGTVEGTPPGSRGSEARVSAASVRPGRSSSRVSYGSRTILPTVVLASIAACASAAFSSG